MIRIIIAAVLLAAPAAVLAEAPAPDCRAESVELRDLSFLSGSWRGGSGEEAFEEHWSEPLGTTMIGTFRWVRKGKPHMYEFMTIESEQGRPVLWMRHFSPALVAWEEKESALRWTISACGANDVTFAQSGTETKLRFQRSDEDELTITLVKMRDGKESAAPFNYRRIGSVAK